MKYLNIDGLELRVRIVYGSLTRIFEIAEGPNAGTAITGKQIRDVIGTRYNYQLDVEPDPAYPEDYDQLYEIITAPQDSHTVSFPYGQQTLTFDAMVYSGQDTLGATFGGVNRWTGLRLSFSALAPQRSV